MRHLLEIDDLTPAEVVEVLDRAMISKPERVLDGLGTALVFEKPSLRTRNSMEMAAIQLGGHPVMIMADEVGLDKRESVEDVTRTLAGYYAVIGARVFDHNFVERMACLDRVPIVNLLSDQAHPMQALADLLTIYQEFGRLDVTVAYVGDANNVARSLGLAVAMTGGSFRIAAPEGYGFSEVDENRIRVRGSIEMFDRPIDAVKGANVIYTDVWTSMGQELEADTRRIAFKDFTIDETLLGAAATNYVFLHCLPAHRGEEVAAHVIDGVKSRVWRQAENRMHAARGLLWWLIESNEEVS